MVTTRNFGNFPVPEVGGPNDALSYVFSVAADQRVLPDVNQKGDLPTLVLFFDRDAAVPSGGPAAAEKVLLIHRWHREGGRLDPLADVRAARTILRRDAAHQRHCSRSDRNQQ